MDLRSGQGEVIVPVQNPDPFTACVILGMRVDPRINYLFAAGCFAGNAFVYDADTGALIMEYQSSKSGPFGLVNDLTIANDAVYFTDTDHLDGVASGAIFASSLYVNNARYATFPDPATPYALTKLPIRP